MKINLTMKGSSITMRKYIMLIAIIFMSSFLLIACSNDGTAETEGVDEVEIEEESDREEETNDEVDDLEVEGEDIEFGDKVDMGEAVAIEDVLSFIDDIKYPDLQLKDDQEESKFFVKKKGASGEDPEYFLNLEYRGYDASGTSTFLLVIVSTDEEEFEEKVSEESTETKTLANGTDIEYLEEDNGRKRVYLADGEYYYIFSTARDDRAMSEEALMNAVEGLSEKNAVYDFVKGGFEESAEKYLAMPTYFPENIDFNTVTIYDDALKFDYLSRYYIEEDERVFTSVNLFVSDELSPYTIEDAEEIELPSGQKAYLSTEHENDYKNEVFLEKDEYVVELSATNLERPLGDEEAGEVKQIADSIERVDSE